MATYFYDIAKIYERGLINGNVDEKLINPMIITVQDIYILPLIGTGLFDEITAQIIAGNVSANNKTLLNSYIQPTMLWYIMYEFTFAGHFKYMNKGVMERNSESAQPTSIQNLERIAKPHKDKAEHYAERTTKFLLQNSSTYPLYFNAGNGIDTVFPDVNNFSSGLSLDDDSTPNRSSMTFDKPKYTQVSNIGMPIKS